MTNKKDIEMRVNLDISMSEARLIKDSLELLARLHMGQFDLIEQEVTHSNPELIKNHAFKEQLEALEQLSGLRNKGIRSQDISPRSKSAWDMHQFLRQVLGYLKNPSGGIQTTYDMPMVTHPETSITISLPISIRERKSPLKAQQELINKIKLNSNME